MRLLNTSTTRRRAVEVRLGGKWTPLREVLETRPLLNAEVSVGGLEGSQLQRE
ncbi:uncharacterized protein BDZ99DRAFT_462178 [Mytilinidion resinicola]|uniref:Uncharacterized protein n=1 Tax=Mytilinidion resinicola TaxID=574789 RepID=A0A6A6YSI7_9PEZI|nr:uncharacterized protein BDZ99DRAFT_462178 [Mytilinidion resinicola]KAF2810877.1 hypothetical protein BDZ99DRAFT_462178 [Mytilinidion resinicola]